jgi:cytochrome b subunit of formate dehydrogenase
MNPAILALFVPIIFIVGLFISIALHIYYKYKARVATAEHLSGESPELWCRAEAMARASVSRSASLRVGGFLTGAGIGTALGVFLGATDKMWSFLGSLCEFNRGWEINDVTQFSIYVFFIMACAMLIGGVGMVAAYFVDRALEGKK